MSVPSATAPQLPQERPYADPERLALSRRRGRRNAVVAGTSTVLVFVLVGVAIVSAPGWPVVQERFFSLEAAVSAWPEVVGAFWLNIRIFLVAECVILVLSLLVALARGLPGPVFLPLRILAAIYVDVFRGIPTILLIYLLGFGVPALQLPGVPSSALFWGGVALVLSYTAYVSEVYRAGIESVHPSQRAAARSLGLSGVQATRYVVLPQAIRSVVPPLLNDFIALQKDTALVSVLGPIEALRAAQIDASFDFNYTPYVVAALLFVALTLPLTRLTDWLQRRDRRRRLETGA